MKSIARPQPLRPAGKIIFISHAGADKPRLGPYLEHLLDRTSKLPETVFLWIDRPGKVGWPQPGRPSVGGLAKNQRIRQLPSGAAWSATIAEAVKYSDCVLIIYSGAAEAEKSSVFANEILVALFEKKAVTISLDPIRKQEKPDILLRYIQWTDVSHFVSSSGDDGAFDAAIDQIIGIIFSTEYEGIFPPVAEDGGEISISGLKDLTDQQRKREMALLSSARGIEQKIVDRRYIADIYVERQAIAESLERFSTSDAQTFAILGDAGMGKTSFLCTAANELGRSGYVLFFLAVELHGGLKAALQNEIGGFVGKHGLGSALSLLAKEAVRAGRRLTIFIDGLNEVTTGRQTVRAELNELIRETNDSGIHWIVTCRTIDWDYWLRNDNNMIGPFGRSVYSERNESTTSATVAEFDVEEFTIAWRKYKVEFGLVGDLSPRVRELCREPFMLRLVAEIYKGGKLIPTDVDAMQLFDRYFSERFPVQIHLMAVYKMLLAAAKRALEHGNAYIDIVNVGSDEFVICERLMHENVLVRRTDTHLSFRFELVLEYVISKYILNSISPDADGAEKFSAIMDAATSPSINIPGAIENILVAWQSDESIVSGILYQFSTRESDRWKTMVCATLRKLVQLPRGIDQVIEHLAGDNNFILRRYLAQALSVHRNDVPRIVPLLMLDKSTWERRETAANVLRWSREVSTVDATSQLISLADDPHWRVRRAVGYAMQERWSVDPNERRVALANLRDYSWRQRHSICISLIGCSALMGFPEGDALKTLMTDDNHQVRWMVANYLTRYVDAKKSGMIEHLVADPDAWVRGRTASELISADQSVRSSSAVADALHVLAHDDEIGVRIRIARELQKVASEPWAQTLLHGYLTDVPEVSFAAAYTLGGAPLGNVVDLFGDDVVADAEVRLWVIRERIARGEVDPRTSRFSPLRDALSRAVELPAESDRYMRIIDSMTSLISAAADQLAPASVEQRRFFEVICEDRDESVRWALVLYLELYAGSEVHVDHKLEMLAQLSNDHHFWVRREVALALGRWSNEILEGERITLLRQMMASELASSEACKDEVLHYIRQALEFSDLYSG